MSTTKAYPLQWPSGWPRTAYRETARFKTKLSAALSFLHHEIGLMGGKNLILSSNCTLGTESPKDPGVVAYFTLRETAIAIPCDRWNKVHDNVKAIGLTVEAMRGMERWGAKHMITAMFQGFKALPERTGQSCWEILGIEYDPHITTEDTVMLAWRSKANSAHPDKPGGSHESMTALNEAKDIALSTIRNNRP